MQEGNAANVPRLVIANQMKRIPYIGLLSSQIEKIASLGASIDFDIMADMSAGDPA